METTGKQTFKKYECLSCGHVSEQRSESMKYTFVKLRERRFEWSVGYWYLKLTDFVDVVNYCLRGRTGYVETAFLDYMKKQNGDEKHFTNRLATSINFIAELKDKSFIYELADKESEMMNNMIRHLGNGYFVCVNSAGGYLIDDGSGRYDVLETVESDRMIFPSDLKITIVQWPHGTHWYAKVGSTDVVVDGERKWNTYEYAEKMANKFSQGMKK